MTVDIPVASERPDLAARSAGIWRTIPDDPWLWVARVLMPLVMLGLWELAAHFSHLVPGVVPTVLTLANELSSGDLMGHALSTGQAVLYGFVLAAAFSVPVAIAVGRNRFVYEVGEPLFAAAFALPRVILYPVMLSFLGVGLQSKTLMAFLGAFFPVVLMATAGVRNVDEVLVRFGRTLELNRRRMFLKIILPAAVPSFLSGLRIGFSVSFVAVVVAELFLARDGLGVVIQRSYARLQLDQMFAAVLLVTAAAFLGNVLLRFAERRLHRSRA